MRHISKCTNCGKYTMKDVCSCGSKTLFSRPLKYTPDDKITAYRRKAKYEEYLRRDLL